MEQHILYMFFYLKSMFKTSNRRQSDNVTPFGLNQTLSLIVYRSDKLLDPSLSGSTNS